MRRKISQNKDNLIIAVELLKNTGEKIKLIERLIKNTVKGNISLVTETIKKINRNSVILSLFGMILIGLTQVFQIAEKRRSFNELIIVMSWVFVWKAIELFFFERVVLI